MNEQINNTRFRTQIVQQMSKAKFWTKFRNSEIPTKPKQKQTCGNNTRAIDTLVPFVLADKLRGLGRKLGAWFLRPHPSTCVAIFNQGADVHCRQLCLTFVTATIEATKFGIGNVSVHMLMVFYR